MEKYILENDLKVFGTQVETFPNGIGEAFGALIAMLPEAKERSYYGISQFANNGTILYYATAEETYNGEAETYNCDRYVIERGEYLIGNVNDWPRKTDCIKDIFHEMMQLSRVDKTKPCVEWYKNDDEMLCMIKMAE